jgi:hypothetical protein
LQDAVQRDATLASLVEQVSDYLKDQRQGRLFPGREIGSTLHRFVDWALSLDLSGLSARAVYCLLLALDAITDYRPVECNAFYRIRWEEIDRCLASRWPELYPRFHEIFMSSCQRMAAHAPRLVVWDRLSVEYFADSEQPDSGVSGLTITSHVFASHALLDQSFRSLDFCEWAITQIEGSECRRKEAIISCLESFLYCVHAKDHPARYYDLFLMLAPHLAAIFLNSDLAPVLCQSLSILLWFVRRRCYESPDLADFEESVNVVWELLDQETAAHEMRGLATAMVKELGKQPEFRLESPVEVGPVFHGVDGSSCSQTDDWARLGHWGICEGDTVDKPPCSPGDTSPERDEHADELGWDWAILNPLQLELPTVRDGWPPFSISPEPGEVVQEFEVAWDASSPEHPEPDTVDDPMWPPVKPLPEPDEIVQEFEVDRDARGLERLGPDTIDDAVWPPATPLPEPEAVVREFEVDRDAPSLEQLEQLEPDPVDDPGWPPGNAPPQPGEPVPNLQELEPDPTNPDIPRPSFMCREAYDAVRVDEAEYEYEYVREYEYEEEEEEECRDWCIRP